MTDKIKKLMDVFDELDIWYEIISDHEIAIVNQLTHTHLFEHTLDEIDANPDKMGVYDIESLTRFCDRGEKGLNYCTTTFPPDMDENACEAEMDYGMERGGD